MLRLPLKELTSQRFREKFNLSIQPTDKRHIFSLGKITNCLPLTI